MRSVLAAFVLVGCESPDPAPLVREMAPVAGPDAPPPRVGELASVDSVRVLKLESFPVQAFAYVTGQHPDGTTRIEGAEQLLNGNVIAIKLTTTRSAEGAGEATEAVPYDYRIPLKIVGFPAGRYQVIVNGATAELVLERANGTGFEGGSFGDPAVNPNAAF